MDGERRNAYSRGNSKAIAVIATICSMDGLHPHGGSLGSPSSVQKTAPCPHLGKRAYSIADTVTGSPASSFEGMAKGFYWAEDCGAVPCATVVSLSSHEYPRDFNWSARILARSSVLTAVLENSS